MGSRGQLNDSGFFYLQGDLEILRLFKACSCYNVAMI